MLIEKNSLVQAFKGFGSVGWIRNGNFEAPARSFYKSKCLLVGWSVGLSVEKKFCKEEKIKNQNPLIIFDYLINFWHCWGDRVTTKMDSKEN